jgi:outer membrane lipoprotein-sorting protein
MKTRIILLALAATLTLASAYAQAESAREEMKTQAASIPDIRTAVNGRKLH